MPLKNRKTIFKVCFILVSICSLYFVPWKLVKTYITPLPDTIQEEIDQAINLGYAGIIIWIDEANNPGKPYTSGWHNKEQKIPTKSNAFFKIASISKLYIAVAVAKLVSRGVLDLNKPLSEYLPELKNRIENSELIKLSHLLHHTSGIPNYTDTDNFWSSPTNTYEESLALIIDKPALFKPGTSYEYCNTNFLLIEKILDKALGYQNFQFIQKEILDPLQLDHTFSTIKDVNIEDIMSGYHKGYPFDLKTDDIGMVAQAEDLAVFIRALNNSSIFTQEEEEIYSSIYKYEHAGWVPGYQSFAKYYEDIDAVIIHFYSTTDPKLYLWNLSEIINNRIVSILRKQSN